MNKTVRFFILGAAFLIMGNLAATSQTPEDAQKIINAAAAKAKAENKAVFVHFSASW